MLFRVLEGMYRLVGNVKKRWWVIMLAGAFLALGVQHAVGETVSPTPPSTSPMLRVDFQNGLLSVEARNGPWKKVLSEVREKTGIFLNVSLPLEGTATVSFKDLPIEQAFRHLFGPDANFAIFYRGRDSSASAVPSEVWVLGKGSGEASTDPLQAVTKEFAKNQQAAQNAAMISPNREVRLKAIAYLGQQANRPAMTTLLKIAALDRRAEFDIQQGATDALRSLVKNNPQAREILTNIVEAGGPPEVQQLATDILGTRPEPVDDEKTSDD